MSFCPNCRLLPNLPLDTIILAFDAHGGALTGEVCAERSRRLVLRYCGPTANFDAPGVVSKRRAEPLYEALLLTAQQLPEPVSWVLFASRALPLVDL